MRVYLASSKKYIGKIDEDNYIVNELLQKDFNTTILPLDVICSTVEEGDIVLLKSIWGYHENHKLFLKQIKLLKDKNVKLINDYDFIFWNIFKDKYFKDLRNVSIVPTEVITITSTTSCDKLKDKIILLGKKFNTNYLVVKPTVSASGYMTFKINVSETFDHPLQKILENRSVDYMIQPFKEEIRNGEISVIVINGKIKYGINRFPGLFFDKKEVEFIDRYFIGNEYVDIVKKIIEEINVLFEKLPHIMRLDVIKSSVGCELMELELIDPDLFLKHAPLKVRNEVVSDIVSCVLK